MIQFPEPWGGGEGDSHIKRTWMLVRNFFTPKGSPFDKQNRLALDRVKSINPLTPKGSPFDK